LTLAPPGPKTWFEKLYRKTRTQKGGSHKENNPTTFEEKHIGNMVVTTKEVEVCL